jgi:hypothetical protein
MSGMRRMLLLGTLLLMPLCAQARAMDGPIVAHATMRGHDVPVYRIGEVLAPDAPGGMETFAVRVAYVLRGWTRTHGVEAIGNLCRTPDGSRWGTVLLTVDAHVASPVTNACPDGMLATGVDIHSHPQHQRYRPNAIDQLFLGRSFTGDERINTFPDQFSDDDFVHPGYMVGRSGLHYQGGRDAIRLVRDLREPAPAWASDDARRIVAADTSRVSLLASVRTDQGGVAP